jgi:hypothetical protein
VRRNRTFTLGITGGGLCIAAALLVGSVPAGALTTPQVAIPTPPVSVSVPANAVAPKVNPLASLKAAPVSVALPITLLGNEIASMLLPEQDSTTGTNTTGQGSPLANVSAPVNVCSTSAGILANAASSCSTTSVGTNHQGAIGNADVPITGDDNAVGLLGQDSSALGLNSSSQPASTTQDGAINAFIPISLCAINVGLVGNTSSSCDTTGTNGVTTQKGVVDATAPVSVCDVIVEIGGDSADACPTQPDSQQQSGQLADVYAPVGVCGVIVVLDGQGAGQCQPSSGFPLAGGAPTNPLSQSAPVDAVLPVNACSIVVAVDGSASNACEPNHVASSQTGSAPVSAPATVCAAAAALEGTANDTCTGAGNTGKPIGTQGSAGSGASVPVTICGIEAAVGSASATCPLLAAALAPTAPTAPGSAGSPGSPGSAGSGVLPLAPASVVPTGSATGKAGLAFTGAWLALELVIGLVLVLSGLAITMVSRRRRRLVAGPAASSR